MAKLWGGRFTKEITNSALVDLNNSLPFDSRLFSEDIDCSKAYAKILKTVHILTEEECDVIEKSLEIIRYDWIEKLIIFEPTDEDVHTVNERKLIEICGKIGEKLHTGRSRNDQVATDVRLWLKKAIREILEEICNVIKTGIQLAEKYKDVIMPGYTHLQRAQPILFSHWIMSHCFALQEDCLRLKNLYSSADVLILGSGAIAGNPLNIDRELLAKFLQFSKVSQNSIHAVSDRDFAVEFNFIASLTSLHLSRLAEDVILYASKEFNFVQVAEEFSTGSSLMPQKRNPDSLELIRGVSGEIFGSLTGLMMIIKGLPSSYNKDLQFDKKLLFDSFDQLGKILEVTEGVLKTLKVNKENCEKALSKDMLATDVAYYLVKKGVPFRSAHHLVGKVVQYCEQYKMELTEVPLPELKKISDAFDKDITKCFSFRDSVEQYSVLGGTSTASVEHQMKTLKDFCSKRVI